MLKYFRSVHQPLTPKALHALFAIVFLFSCALGSPALATEPYESANELKVSSFLPEPLLNSTLFTVEERILNDGFINTYSVHSEIGTFQVSSNIALYKLLQEINTIEEMRKVEESEVFISSLKTSGMKTLDGVKSLFTAPDEALENAASGLSSLFSRAEESLFRSSPGQTEDSRVEQTVGFSNAKRQIAYKYNVDVYSRNQVLQEHLDRLAWADYAGGLTLGVATMPIGGLAGATLTVSGTARLLGEVIATTPPAELKLLNREKLANMNIDEDLADLFIENPNFSPLQQTAIVMSLEKVETAGNRKLPLQVALQVQDQDTAGTVTAIMTMFGGYHDKIATLKKFERIARIFCAVDKNGTFVVMLPADYITWNRQLANGIGAAAAQKERSRELWTLGTMSVKAREQLQQAGWRVAENVASSIGFQPGSGGSKK